MHRHHSLAHCLATTVKFSTSRVVYSHPTPRRFSLRSIPSISLHRARSLHQQSTSHHETPKSLYVQHAIRTLRPEALTEDDYLYLPNEQDYCSVWDAMTPATNPLSTDTRRPFATFRAGDKDTPLPAGLSGFLYYYMTPGPAPPASGEIRFRMTPGSSPVGFNRGQNLLSRYMLPWRIQLTTIAYNNAYTVFREILLRDGLVTGETMAVAAEMGRVRAYWRKEQAQAIVHSFGQPWYLSFDSKAHWWHFMGKDKLYYNSPMPNILSWRIGAERLPSPWKGGAICAFARDNHPRHRKRRVIKVKVLKIVSPPSRNLLFPGELRYLVHDPPTEGKDIRCGHPLWNLDLDDCDPARSEAFGVLFENAELPPLRTQKALRPKAPGEREWEMAKTMTKQTERGRVLQPRAK